MGALSRALEGIDWALIGGMAVSLRSVPRFTADLDALVWAVGLDISRLLVRLREQGFAARPEDPVRFAQRHFAIPLKHEQGFFADVLLAYTPIERGILDRASVLADPGVPVAIAMDLIVMKSIAGRPQDLADVEKLREALDEHEITEIDRLVAEARAMLAPPDE